MPASATRSCLNRDQHEEIYAHAFRLHWFASRKDVAMLSRIVTRVASMQDAQGFWAHEYPNPFITGVVVHALETARKAGAEVPGPIYRKAAEALLSTRGSRRPPDLPVRRPAARRARRIRCRGRRSASWRSTRRES